jgi:hypothetical protein
MRPLAHATLSYIIFDPHWLSPNLVVLPLLDPAPPHAHRESLRLSRPTPVLCLYLFVCAAAASSRALGGKPRPRQPPQLPNPQPQLLHSASSQGRPDESAEGCVVPARWSCLSRNLVYRLL